jgi:hypothetical protein
LGIDLKTTQQTNAIQSLAICKEELDLITMKATIQL